MKPKKRYFVTDAFFRAYSIMEIKLGYHPFFFRWLKETPTGIRDECGAKMGDTFEEAIERLNAKVSYVEVPERWDHDENMDYMDNAEDYNKLCEYLPYFREEEGIEKIMKLRRLRKAVFGY